ncbi:MAG TPA: hypothetical protein PK493_01695, partial [Pseudomonadota bacterium]|nr:hypothetical protein [Pseudomonadota bacterium]
STAVRALGSAVEKSASESGRGIPTARLFSTIVPKLFRWGGATWQNVQDGCFPTHSGALGYF